MKISLKIILLSIIIFFSLLLRGQNYNVKQISGLEGLSQSTVNSVCVDRIGYIWLGTDFGLNRFDGRTIRKYFSETGNTNSLLSDFINAVYEDRDGNIWISTDDGLCLYDRKLDNFIQNPLNLETNIVGDLVVENETELWFSGNNANFQVYNKSSNKVYEKKIDPQIENYQAYWIDDMVEYDDSHFLVILHNYGLALFSTKSGKLKSFLKLEVKKFTGIEKIGNSFYVSAYEDVYKISKSGKIEGTFNRRNLGIGENIFLDVKLNPQDETVWIASDLNGVFIVDKDFNIVRRLESGADANKILPENSIKKIEFVNPQMVVLASVRCGAIILYNSGIRQFRYNNGHESGPSDKSVLCLEEDSDNNIWIGTDGEGINNYNRKTENFEVYKDPDVRIVTTILDFSPDKLLVGSYQKGLFFFDKKIKQFTDAHKHPLFENINKKVRHKIYKDSESNIWISDGALAKINMEKNSFERINRVTHPKIFQNLSPIYFSAFESVSGKLWFTTVGGVYAYDYSTGKMSDGISSIEFNELAGIVIYSVEEDANGNLLLGTGKGLYICNKIDNTLKVLVDDKDFNNNVFSALYVDKKERLWAGTNENLLRINSVDSINEVSVYYQLEAKGGVEYRHGAVLRSWDNKLYMGNNDGITCLVPEEVDIDRSIPEVVITSFKRIGNHKNEMIDSTVVVDLKEDMEVTFRYTPAMYRINFNAFNIPFEEYTEYSYMLENYEDIWHTGTSGTAVYTNIPSGEYIFKVRSTNKTGKWCAKTTNIRIKILPPWYETAWFWGIVFIVITGIIIVVWRESLVRLKLKHQLELQETEQEQLKASNLHKLQFFTNISHELKTPLTLIYSPLRQLLKKNVSDNEIRIALPSLYRNVRRMMALIDQLLEFRKAEMSTLKMKPYKVDCIEVCEEIIDYFEYYSKVEGIKLILEAAEDHMEVELDRDKFTKIMFNLISNALKHSTSGDSVFIFVSFDDDNIQVAVKDCGPGIPEKVQKHIFERYYQQEKEVSGTGIGLALTKHLVELHKGKISVESEEGEGATFYIVLPRKQEGIVAQSIVEKQKLFEKMESFVSSPSLLNLNVQKEMTLLVVEDEWELRHFLKNELSVDYSVKTAGNGKDGFKAAVKHVPDLIISDVMMPEMNGYQLCENIKNDIRISHVPVILLTAKTQTEHHIEGLNAGADMYIPKPFDLELLKLQVATLIRNRQLLKNRFSTDPEVESSDLTHNSIDKDFMDKAITLVEENMENQYFRVSDFVQQMGMSRSLVYNKINAIAGKPVKDFILNIRLQKAGKLITSSNKPVSEIAYECGFTDPSYFSTVFKRYYSQSPVSYRNNYLKESLISHELND